MIIFLKKHIDSLKLFAGITLMVFFSRLVLYLTFIFYSLINKTPFGLNNFIQAINKFDAEWYKDIVLNGYRIVEWSPCKYNWNFFPLFPLLIKFTRLIIPIDPYILGTIVNSFLLIFVCFFAYKYIVLTRFNKKIGYLSVFLLCFGPWSMYSAELMSETLFMLLLILVFYCMKSNRLILMGIFGGLLSATRSNGVLIVIPIIIYFYAINPEKTFKNKLISLLKNSKLIFAICLIPIGIFSYMLYLQIKFHDGLGFIHSQQYGWNHKFKGIFSVLISSLSDAPLLFIFVCFALFVIVCLIKEGRLYEALFPLLTLLLEMPYTIGSSPRYMFSTFTIMFGLLDFIFNIKLLKKNIFQIPFFTILFLLEIELSSFLMFNQFGKYVV